MYKIQDILKKQQEYSQEGCLSYKLFNVESSKILVGRIAINI